jgi:predicted GIY-YIG superfamily endonuclease
MSAYVYKFQNAEGETIYVGFTKNIKGRIRSQHFSTNGHLPKACYDETEMVVYSKCLHEDDAKIKERYLINTLSPTYNDKMNNGSSFNFIIDDFEWKYIAFKKKRAAPPVSKEIKNIQIHLSEMMAPSLPAGQHFLTTSEDPGPVVDVFAFTPEKPIQGVAINGDLWLTAISVCEFAYTQIGDATKIRAIQFVQHGFIEAQDICVVANRRFILREDLGQRAVDVRTGLNCSTQTLLLRASSLAGFIEGLFDRETRDIRKRIESGARVKIRSRYGEGRDPLAYYPSFDYYLERQMGEEKNCACIETIHHRLKSICNSVRSVRVDGASLPQEAPPTPDQPFSVGFAS